MSRQKGTGLLSDDPRDGSDARPDELGRSDFTDYIGQLVESVREQSESSVMALIGDWGSGKTSVLNLLRARLRSESGEWLLGEFNPWSYPDAASLQRGFFAELTHALPRNARPSGARAKVGDLARSLSPLGALGGLVGLDAERAIQALGELVGGDTSASAARRAAEESLRRLERPVLMVIDDLDRLTPDELLEVLKLVRLVGRLPHVYYLLSYDERTLLDILRRTAVAGEDEERARAYLEKIVQVRLDMPALRAAQRLELLDEGLNVILKSNGVMLTESDVRRLNEVYSAVLDRRLTTPRAITRFLGQVQAFYRPLHGEVDFVDFVLVSWLRTQEPGVYALLNGRREALLGRSLHAWRYGDDSRAATARREFWKEELDAAKIDKRHREGVEQVLAELFPEIRATFASGPHPTRAIERSTPRAISDPDYFDRYVSFGVPDDDLPDAVVFEALRDLVDVRETRAVQRLRQELRDNTTRAIRKIEMLREAGPVPESAIFVFIAEIWPTIDPRRTEIFTNQRQVAESGAGRCLIEMDPTEALETVRRVVAAPDGGPFIVNVVRRLSRGKRSPYSDTLSADYDLGPFVQVAVESIVRGLAASGASSPLGDGAMSGFWAWRELDATGASNWLRGKVERGEWTLLETIGALTSVATSMGTEEARTSIGGFELLVADEVFGLDRILEHLAVEVDAVEPLAGGAYEVPATRENRIAFALTALRGARSQRSGERTADTS